MEVCWLETKHTSIGDHDVQLAHFLFDQLRCRLVQWYICRVEGDREDLVGV